MPVRVNLTDRQQHILWATVRHYIATAEPVGSKALVDEYNLSVSPATIRNAMGFLEKVGLLYQPHTSAGRVPSDSGYRIYVDQLIQPSDILGSKVEQVLDQLNWSDGRMEAALRGASQILAAISGYIALITVPQTNMASLRHLQLVQLEPGQVMLIVVTDAYETQSVLVKLPQEAEGKKQDAEIVDRELQILSNFLNSKLRGRSLSELSTIDWSELDRDFEIYAEWMGTMLAEIRQRVETPSYTRILIGGLAEVLRLPEFSQLQQVQTLVQLLEQEQELLWPLIFESTQLEAPGKRVTVRIGSENPLEPIQSCTLISSTYCRGSLPVGSVGVLGPTRMVYENAIAVVEAAADYLSEAMGGKKL
ncbi:MAG: heat-inducible transcriptional repressor HrcA [Oscillatoriaceae cyanobacterium Prado104]|jgi:heat-inducible transcriptional repressor|nr:heat-inducible transcriptional repressor HrcA [Oscillatoriaceae cyanobacterium Prado104]